jgi:accessory gene regulator B
MLHSVKKCFRNITIDLDYKEKDAIEYVSRVILTDLTKTLIFFCIFSILGIRQHIIIMLLYTIPLRINVGGFHLKNYVTCLSFSAIYFASIYNINTFISFNVYGLVFIATICTGLIFMLAPVIPLERFDVTSINKIALKIRGVVISLIYLLIFIIYPSIYTRYGIWVVIVQTILIVITEVNCYVKKIKRKIY